MNVDDMRDAATAHDEGDDDEEQEDDSYGVEDDHHKCFCIEMY